MCLHKVRLLSSSVGDSMNKKKLSSVISVILNMTIKETLLLFRIQAIPAFHYFMSPDLRGGGHIVFGADPIGISATLSCLHDIL